MFIVSYYTKLLSRELKESGLIKGKITFFERHPMLYSHLQLLISGIIAFVIMFAWIKLSEGK
jgi:hypothetical protein